MTKVPDKPARQAARFVPAAIIFLAALGVYSNTLRNGFILDDHQQLLLNTLIRDVRNLPEIFLRSVWTFEGAPPTSNYYRPMVNVFYLIGNYVSGFNALGYHLMNILFHAGSSVLVFLIAARLPGGAASQDQGLIDKPLAVSFLSPSFIAGLLFAVHPVHVEAVTWIAGLSDVSFAFFFLLSFFLYLRSRGGYGLTYVFAVSAFVLSVLCKEPGLTLPFILIAYDHAFRNGSLGPLRRWRSYAPYFIAAGCYFAIRFYVLGGMTPLRRFATLSAFEQAINVFPLFARYLRMLLLPVNLNFWPVFTPVTSLFSGEAMVSLFISAAFALLVVLALRKNSAVFLGLMLVLIPLVPAFYLKGIIGKPVADRYLYLPSAGELVLLAWLLSWLKAGRPAAAKGLLAAVVILITVYSAETLERNTVWKDEYTLFSDTVRKSPNSVMPHLEFGNALLAKGLFDEAVEQYRIAMQMEPELYVIYYHLGLALAGGGRLYEAIEQYHTAIMLNPNRPQIHEDLGRAYGKAGFKDDALREFKIAAEMRPSARSFNLLGVAYAQKGEADGAVENFRMAASLDPGREDYRRNLSAALEMKESSTKKGEREISFFWEYEPRTLNNSELFSFVW